MLYKLESNCKWQHIQVAILANSAVSAFIEITWKWKYIRWIFWKCIQKIEVFNYDETSIANKTKWWNQRNLSKKNINKPKYFNTPQVKDTHT